MTSREQLVLDILDAGLKQIESPDGWCQYELWGMYEGKLRCCAKGAAIRASRKICKERGTADALEEAIGYLWRAANGMGYASVVELNDGAPDRHAQVVECYRRAIEACRADLKKETTHE